MFASFLVLLLPPLFLATSFFFSFSSLSLSRDLSLDTDRPEDVTNLMSVHQISSQLTVLLPDTRRPGISRAKTLFLPTNNQI